MRASCSTRWSKPELFYSEREPVGISTVKKNFWQVSLTPRDQDLPMGSWAFWRNELRAIVIMK
jgi:hypothetical protein